jgi:hypothetical protein
MTKTIASIPTNWLSVVITALLVLLAILLNSNSTGYIRSGGEDDDGSGIGGTGRTLGLQHTGSFKPVLGMTKGNQEIRIINNPEIFAAPVTPPVEFSIVSLSQQNSSLSPARPTITFHAAQAPHSEQLSIQEALQHSLDTKALLHQFSDESAQSGNNDDTVAWQELKQMIAGEVEVEQPGLSATDNNSFEVENNIPTAEVFKRIQRPNLPPVLRIRPVERITVLPPRIKRMRI